MIETSIPDIECRACGKRGEEIRFCENWICREWFWREVYQKERETEGARAVYSWPALCAEVLAREDYTCQHCGERHPEGTLEIHHIIPVSKMGSNRPDNLMALCSECHKKIHARSRFTRHRDQCELDIE
jgi:5-methylcytosine-specific restriction endonuclease McrA